MKTKTPKKETACLQQTAQKNNQQNKTYRIASLKASGKLKLQLGNLLIYLNQSQQSGLQQVFETKLRQFVDLKYSGVKL